MYIEDPPNLRNAIDGTLLALVPGGDLGLNDLGSSTHVVTRVPSCYMARTPVNNAAFATFLDTVRPAFADVAAWIWLHGEASGNEISNCGVQRRDSRYEAVQGLETEPVSYVSWYGAEAYCRWARLRLPRELEWLRGARVAATGQIDLAEGGMEWCSDWYRPSLVAPPVETFVQYRVLRRAAWKSHPRDIEARHRWHASVPPFGFRCALDAQDSSHVYLLRTAPEPSGDLLRPARMDPVEPDRLLRGPGQQDTS